MWHGSNDSGITQLGGADPASPFLHYLDGDRTRYGIISAAPNRATGQDELHRRMLPVLPLIQYLQSGQGPLCSRTLVSAVGTSANGMVRPCSCPASKRSWQGAPKTRSTPCLRHPIARSP